MPYVTGGDPGASVVRHQIDIPDDFLFRAAVRGALYELTNPYNWEQTPTGDLTPDEAAALALLMMETFVTGGGGDVEHIETLSGVAAAYVFENIPQDYDHLVAIYSLKSDRESEQDNLGVMMNGDTGANYAKGEARLLSNSTVLASGDSGDNSIVFTWAVGGADNFSNDYATGEILFPGYRTDGPNKSAILQGFNRRGQFSISALANLVQAGYWSGALVDVDELEFFPTIGDEFTGASYIDLYGIRGA